MKKINNFPCKICDHPWRTHRKMTLGLYNYGGCDACYSKELAYKRKGKKTRFSFIHEFKPDNLKYLEQKYNANKP